MTKKKTSAKEQTERSLLYFLAHPFRFIGDLFKEYIDIENETEEKFAPRQIIKPARNDKDLLGNEGELLGADFLLSRGYKILYRNCKFPSCEIDLIVQPPNSYIYVFVEVKTRKNTAYGTPLEGVDQRRIQKLLAAADEFIQWKHLQNPLIRFDILSILWLPNCSPHIEHFQNYFDENGNVLM